ncbi:MAG: class I SAM-dependent methyltransferase [Halothermotrichaceae bacterium]
MKCILCGSEQIRRIKPEIYFRCNQCDLIFIDKQEIVSKEEEYKTYAQHENSFECKGYVEMFHRFINKVIKPYKSEISTALDFGCGNGPVLASLLEDEMNFKTDIYDPNFYPEKVYANKKYDLITSTEVFEHLKNPVKTLKLLYSHLSEQGLLAVMTSFHSSIDDFAEWWYIRDKTHITFYSDKTFYWIEENMPFELVYMDGKKYCLFRKKKY